jgi:hypothetical protein
MRIWWPSQRPWLRMKPTKTGNVIIFTRPLYLPVEYTNKRRVAFLRALNTRAFAVQVDETALANFSYGDAWSNRARDTLSRACSGKRAAIQLVNGIDYLWQCVTPQQELCCLIGTFDALLS